MSWRSTNRLKYRNKMTRIAGSSRVYHSKREALDALWLQQLKEQGKIKEVQEQVRIRLVAYNQDGTKSHHFGDHIVDFLVTLNDGRQKYVETKGLALQIWKQFKKPMTELISNIPYLVNPNEKDLLA